MSVESTIRKPASRESIIEEAILLAEEKGWNSVTVRAIAMRLDYAPPVLYSHFKSKDDLTESILKKGFEILNSRMKDALEKGGTPEEKLLILATERFNFALEHTSLHDLMFATGCPVWHRETIFQGICHTRTIVQSLLREISGRKDDCLDLITNFISLIRGYTFFATELPKDLSDEKFFGGVAPSKALELAMSRFIFSVKKHD